MGIIKRIPFTRDLSWIKKRLTTLLTREISVEYPRSWWFSWIDWGVEMVIYPTQSPYDLAPVWLVDDLEAAGLTKVEIDQVVNEWKQWLVARLEQCNIVDFDGTHRQVKYDLIDCGDSSDAEETVVEVWIGLDTEPYEFEYNVQRTIYPHQTDCAPQTQVQPPGGLRREPQPRTLGQGNNAPRLGFGEQDQKRNLRVSANRVHRT